MNNQKRAAQDYCATAKKLEEAEVILEGSKKVVQEIYFELENLRKEMGKGLAEGETVTILLPENMAVVITNHASYIQADISRTV